MTHEVNRIKKTNKHNKNPSNTDSLYYFISSQLQSRYFLCLCNREWWCRFDLLLKKTKQNKKDTILTITFYSSHCNLATSV